MFKDFAEAVQIMTISIRANALEHETATPITILENKTSVSHSNNYDRFGSFEQRGRNFSRNSGQFSQNSNRNYSNDRSVNYGATARSNYSNGGRGISPARQNFSNDSRSRAYSPAANYRDNRSNSRNSQSGRSPGRVRFSNNAITTDRDETDPVLLHEIEVRKAELQLLESMHKKGAIPKNHDASINLLMCVNSADVMSDCNDMSVACVDTEILLSDESVSVASVCMLILKMMSMLTMLAVILL